MAVSPASAVVRRALLYVPASSQKMLDKSLKLTSDNITYDLEDSVTPEQKPHARHQVRQHIQALSRRPDTIGEIAVRINAVSTPHAMHDLMALSKLLNLDAIVVPKVNSASDLTFVHDVLRQSMPERFDKANQKPIKLIALIESARAVMDLRSICSTGVKYNLSGLIFAAEDFALDLSLTRTPSLKEFLYARSAIVTAARAFEIPSAIDLVCTAYKGSDGQERLAEECENGKEMGFNGKQCIHPSQVEIVQKIFGPSQEETEWAVRVVIADEKAAAEKKGAWTFQGKMIDAPVTGRARAILAKAEQCGIGSQIKHLQEKWKHQEPE